MALLGDLQRDFEASQAHLERWLDGNRRVLEATDALLQRLRTAAEGETFETRPEWIVAAVGTPTYSPTDATLSAAVAAGRLDLLGDTELRKALASWRQQIDDTREDELLLRELVAFRLVPILADQLRLGAAFDFEPHTSWFVNNVDLASESMQVLEATPALEAAVSQRVFYQRFIVDGLAALHETQASILELIALSTPP